MALAPAPLIKRIRTLAAKAEDVPGVAEVLAGTDAAFHVFNTMIQQSVEMAEREKQNGFARLPSVPGGLWGKCAFGTHFYGGSATPAGMATFLPAVGMGIATGGYALDVKPPEAATSTQKTVTLGSHQAGRLKSIFGAMGNMKCSFPAGKLALAEFDFSGKWSAVAAAALLDPIYPALVPLRVVSTTLSIAGYTSLRIANVTLDLGNTLYLREDGDDATGYCSCVIANRNPKITIDPESHLVADNDIYGDWLAGAEADLSLTITNGTDTCTITASDLQLISPQEADRNGLEIDNIECQLNADDLRFVFA